MSPPPQAFKTGEVSAELKKYPEIAFISLKIQMKAFRDESGTSSLHDTRAKFINLQLFRWTEYYIAVIQILAD